MLLASEVSGQGFTLIVGDRAPLLNAVPQDQEAINQLFDDIQKLLAKYNFEISIACTNEEAMKLQSRLMFSKMFGKLEALCQEEA